MATVDERRERFLELLMNAGVGPSNSFAFLPVLVGLPGSPAEGDGNGGSSAAAEHIVLVNPSTRGMVLLRAEGIGGADFWAAMQEMLAAEGGLRGPPPASKASIEAMPAVERPAGEATNEEEDCAVCLDTLWSALGEENAAAAVKEMPCRHRFHAACIEKWLGTNGSCPICRYRMPEEKQPERKKEPEVIGEEEGGRTRATSAPTREIWVTLGFVRRPGEQRRGSNEDGSTPEQQPSIEQSHD